VGLTALLAQLGCTGAAVEPAPAQRPPDVLLVVLDTVRADHLSAYGYEAPTSPALELLASQGRLYEDVTASSWTWPSHASLFTGLPPWQHGAHFVDAGGVEVVKGFLHAAPIRAEVPTLAERFGEAGYDTVLLSGNELLRAELGLSRGFERVEIFNEDTLTLEAARALLGEERERPLLLVVNFYGAHAPWFVTRGSGDLTERLQQDEPWLGPYVLGPGHAWNPMLRPGGGDSGAERLISGALELPPDGLEVITRLYDGEVQRVDAMLGGLLAAWGPDGVVAVTSDHGEYLGERGLWLHCRTVYSQLTRVPLVLRAPGLEPGVEPTPVQLDQVQGALLALAGLRDEATLLDPRPGPIQAAAWEDQAWSERLGGRFTQGYRLYREGELALVAGMESGAELYDLSDDPGMLRDLASARPEEVERLRAASSAAFVEVEAGSAVEIDAATEQRLRAMGYLD
jgi:arylsulfatase A-like enzyme